MASHVDRKRLERFEAEVRGAVFGPDDEARTVWNGMIDRRPAVVARCSGVADVIRTVAFARERDLPVTIRGGHNVAGRAVCDDGLVIDLSGMRDVRVDPDARTAWVGGGATWADVDHETGAFGLATPGGAVSDTGWGADTRGRHRTPAVRVRAEL